MKKNYYKIVLLSFLLCLSASLLFACGEGNNSFDETQVKTNILDETQYNNTNTLNEKQDNTNILDETQDNRTNVANVDITVLCLEGGNVETTLFSVTPGTEIDSKAVADEDYYFTGWYENDSCFSQEESYCYYALKTTTITARFSKLSKPSVEEVGEETDNQDSIKAANGFELDTATNGLRYAYFVPDLQDDKSYPLVIYVHGKFHGFTDQSFTDNGLVYWTREDMQGLFPEGGAYLWMPKLEETSLSIMQSKEVMQGIEEFVDKNKAIDTARIYIMGGSAGGGLTWNIITEYPDYFARAVILCATKVPDVTEVKAVANMPIWVVSSKKDLIISYKNNQSVTWKRICENSNVPEKCRWTVFNDKVTLPDGTHPVMSHFLAKTIGYNFCTIADKSAFPDMETVDAKGNVYTIAFDDSLVQWLCAE